MGTVPFNNWYHVTIHVYGSWLRGDPRGWRSEHHREHVDGDYKNPPSRGNYDEMYERSRKLMKRAPVKIERNLRQLVLDYILQKLTGDEIEIIAASVDALHVHLLGRFRNRQVRHWVGRAKKHVSHCIRQDGLRNESGGLWAQKCGVFLINDRPHQVNVFKYIMKHELKGAVVWRVGNDANGKRPS